MAQTAEAWHFLNAQGNLTVYRPTQRGTHVKPGSTYRTTGELQLCANGMHYSYHALDALYHAPGPIACRVLLSAERIDNWASPQKGCARWRKVLWMVDAAPIMQRLTLQWAQAKIEDIRKKDPLAVPAVVDVALNLKRRWLEDPGVNPADLNNLERDLLAQYRCYRQSPWAARMPGTNDALSLACSVLGMTHPVIDINNVLNVLDPQRYKGTLVNFDLDTPWNKEFEDRLLQEHLAENVRTHPPTHREE